MVCRLVGTKPLSEPMLEYCYYSNLGGKFSEIFSGVRKFSFKKIYLKLSSGIMVDNLSRPQWVEWKWFQTYASMRIQYITHETVSYQLCAATRDAFVWKASYTKFLDKFWLFGSALCNKNTEASFTFLSQNSGYDVIMLLIKARLCVSYRVHSITKCCSSSNTWHLGHNLSSSGVLGLVCLPRSTSKACELVLNFDIAVLYRGFLTLTRYDSMPKL